MMKMIKYLYTDGCSHTAGGGLEPWKNEIVKCYIEKYNIKISNEKEWAWPRLLNYYLGTILEDKSESGAGADRVWRQVWEYCDNNIDKARETLFILEIPSFFNRLDIRNTWQQQWLICNPEWDYKKGTLVDISLVERYDNKSQIVDIENKKIILTDYLHTFFDFNEYEKSIYQKFAGLFSFFKLNNIQFFIIPNGIHPNIFAQNYGCDLSNNMFLFKYEDNIYNEFTDFTNKTKTRICDELSEYCEKYTQTQDTHPGIQAHKKWAELCAEYIKKNLAESII